MARRKPVFTPFSLFSFQDIITATTGILILLALILALSVVEQKTAPTAVPAAADDVSDLIALHDAVVQEIEKIKASQTTNEISNRVAPQYSADELANKLATAKAASQISQANQAAMAAKKQAMEEEFNESNVTDVIDNLEKKLSKTSAEIIETQKKIEAVQAGDRVVYNFHDTSSAPYIVQIDGKQLLTCKYGVSQAPRVDRTVETFINFAKSLPAQDRYFYLLAKPSGMDNFRKTKHHLDNMGAGVGVDLIGESATAIDPQTGASIR